MRGVVGCILSGRAGEEGRVGIWVRFKGRDDEAPPFAWVIVGQHVLRNAAPSVADEGEMKVQAGDRVSQMEQERGWRVRQEVGRVFARPRNPCESTL